MFNTLQILRCTFFHVEVTAVQTKADAKGEEEYNFEVRSTEATKHSEPNLWELSLRLKFEPSESPLSARYKGKIGVHGVFTTGTIDLATPKFKTKDEIRIRGAELLFSAAQNMVMSITARSTLGELVLPTIDPETFKAEGNKIPNEL